MSFGKIEGKWQLKTVERNGATVKVDTVWYNFQSQSLFMLQVYQTQDDRYDWSTGFRTEKDNILTIEGMDQNITSISDWQDTARVFTIERLTRQHLTLKSSEGYLYDFIKF
jgi:hypothetical protein